MASPSIEPHAQAVSVSPPSSAQRAKLQELEELERQYKEYRDQYEEWKTENSSLAGTPAFEAYVSKFEAWEAQVQRRRTDLQVAAIRAEREPEDRRRRYDRRSNQNTSNKFAKSFAPAVAEPEPISDSDNEEDDSYGGGTASKHDNYNHEHEPDVDDSQFVERQPIERQRSLSATPPPTNVIPVGPKRIRISSRFSANTVKQVTTAPKVQPPQQHQPYLNGMPPQQQVFGSFQPAPINAILPSSSAPVLTNNNINMMMTPTNMRHPPPQTVHPQQNMYPPNMAQPSVSAPAVQPLPPLAAITEMECKELEQLDAYTFMYGMLKWMEKEPMSSMAMILASQQQHSERDNPVHGPNLPPSSSMSADYAAAMGKAPSNFGQQQAFDAADPLYRRWGSRAAPAGHKVIEQQMQTPGMIQTVAAVVGASAIDPAAPGQGVLGAPPGLNNGVLPHQLAVQTIIQQQQQMMHKLANGTAQVPNSSIMGAPPRMPVPPALPQRQLPFTGPPAGMPIPASWTQPQQSQSSNSNVSFNPRVPPPRDYQNPTKLPFQDFAMKTK